MDSSYNIKLEGDILRVGFNKQLPAQGDRLVKDTVAQLERMVESGQLSGGSLLLVDGAQSVPVAYVISHHVAHLYEAVAVLDPKIGRKGYKTYIVTTTHGSLTFKVGDLVETEEMEVDRVTPKIVLCGPPHSGKSCLREGLKKAILLEESAPYPYVITACPDGEGSWYQATYEKDDRFARKIKSEYKGSVTPEFAKTAAVWVRSANELINIVDVGGKISEENKTIMQEATHAVILAGDPGKFSEWEDFCRSLNLQIIAKIHSQLHATTDEVNFHPDWQQNTNELLEKLPLLTGSVHGLKRGEDLSDRPMIQALAKVLIHLTKC